MQIFWSFAMNNFFQSAHCFTASEKHSWLTIQYEIHKLPTFCYPKCRCYQFLPWQLNFEFLEGQWWWMLSGHGINLCLHSDIYPVLITHDHVFQKVSLIFTIPFQKLKKKLPIHWSLCSSVNCFGAQNWIFALGMQTSYYTFHLYVCFKMAVIFVAISHMQVLKSKFILYARRTIAFDLLYPFPYKETKCIFFTNFLI